MNAQLINQKTGEIFEITKEHIVIGRTESITDISVKENSVSRCHCSLDWENGHWYVVDMNSRNFTYINNRQLIPRVKHPLRYGDELRLAQVVFRFEPGSAAAAYDIFISYKNTNKNGSLTRDSKMAEELYQALREKGRNPFLSKYSIDESARADYVDAIDRALESSTVLVAVGTSKENLSSKWVKSEINQFRALMNTESAQTRSIISYRSKDFLPSDLPSGIGQFQSYDDLKALVRFIELCLKNASGFRNEGSETVPIYENSLETGSSCDPDHACSQIDNMLSGRYQILRCVGEGATSRVYLAYDTRLGTTLAVKEYTSGKTDLAVAVMRKEAEVLKSLRHPSIPQIYDIVDTGKTFYVVMEYVQGISLDRMLLERTFFPEEKVLEFAWQLADVLDYLHDYPLPIIYRDIKPANLMLHPDGTLKLIDFGSARIKKGSDSRDMTSLGTVGYAAPEQYRDNAQTDPRTDIYALGVTLHHLVTGKNPALPPYEILPIRQINPKLSRKLEAIIEKCIQIDPQLRYQSAKELLHAIEQARKPGMLDMLTAFFNDSQAPANRQSLLRPISRKQVTGLFGSSGPESIKKDAPKRKPATVVTAESPRPPGRADALQESRSIVPAHTNRRKTSDGDMAETLEKLLSMDEQSRKLVQELIDRLSN